MPKPKQKQDPSKAYDRYIIEASEAYDIPPALIKSVIAQESNFNSEAVSNKGAMGLMQMIASTAREMGVKDAFDPKQNIMGGSKYLREMYDRYGDWVHALAAYNSGPGNVDKAKGIPNIPETKNYIEQIIRRYPEYKVEFQPKGVD